MTETPVQPPVRQRFSVAAWARWEVSRRIELTIAHKLIVLDRFVKAAALLAGGVALLVAERSGFLVRAAARIQSELDVEPGRHLWLRLSDSSSTARTRSDKLAAMHLGLTGRVAFVAASSQGMGRAI